MIRHDYHDKTPDLAERLAKDIAAALRLGLLFTVTSVASQEKFGGLDLVHTKVRYYFEADDPSEFAKQRVGAA